MGEKEKKQSGGGGANVVEHSELTIARWYQIEWRRKEIDLAELAKLRWHQPVVKEVYERWNNQL